MASNAKEMQCPCGGGLYAQCCGRFIGQTRLPDSAEELMRSRYSAFVMRDETYLRATWHAGTRPVEPIVAQGAETAATKWLGLEVRRHETSGDTATVEFVARYKIDGRAHRLHEVSRFVREAGMWFYVNGSFPER